MAPEVSAGRGQGYWLALTISAALGAYWLGTLNLAVSGVPGIGRSVFGAVLGGIVGIELYKSGKGIKLSTGAIFVLPLTLGLSIGRIGCFLGGMEDFTYGTPTALPWGYDFGDGIPRHPVQLYESAAMLVFAGAFFAWSRARPRAASAYGFYLFALWFASDRLLLEFLKPYGRIVNALTVFQIGALVLILYAAFMLWRIWRHHARFETLSLLRPDDLAVRNLPAAGPGQDPH
ncbi:prolipoprotein diacylglyceryl transferase [Dongia sp.]|uniref:prolipoprotein diacylglyceryl transferase n=1 Tax=Dongia sp. TaxID=1977262 RepID=UPI0035B25DCD